MEITPEIKALLQSIDPDIENSFLEGVTQSGPYLDKLPQYDKIPAMYREQGRQGILLTFAGLLSRLSNFTPSIQTLVPGYPFSNSGANFYKNILGEIVLNGRLTLSENSTGASILGVLPAGYRPSQLYTAVVASIGGFVILFVDTNGTIFTNDNLSAGWIALDGIRFTG